MTEYIEREKLAFCIKDDIECCGEPDACYRPIAYGTIRGLKMALKYVNALPVADVVEVVRCKNCIYCKPTAVDEVMACIRNSKYIKPTDYCSYGERKRG